MTARPQPGWIIIVTGPPCSGKTRLASGLAENLGLALLNKDRIKERLFDVLGWGTPQWSNTLGLAANALLFDTMDLLLATGRPFIVESNFKPSRDTQFFLDRIAENGFVPLQVHCDAEPRALLTRFRRRWQGGRRHPGHVDDLNLESISIKLRDRVYGALPIGGELVRIETTDFFYVDHQAIAKLVRMRIAEIEANRTGRDAHEA